MSFEPFVSIITVTYNGKELLEEFFNSIRALTYRNFEIICVDNASSDATVAYVQNAYPEVIVIAHKENCGFSRANNNAVERARGKYIFFVNNDTKLAPDAVSLLAAAMEENAKIGVCGCTMKSYDGTRKFHAGIGMDIFGYPVNNGTVFYVEGSALMIRQEAFARIGGFDESYFMFHEDIDLSWRAWLYGYQVAVCKEAVVYHMLGATAGGNIKEGTYTTTIFRRYFSERNNIRSLCKNYSGIMLVFILPLYVILTMGEMLVFLIMLQPRVAFCYIKAYAWNVKHIQSMRACRKIIQAERVVGDRGIVSKMYKGVGKVLALRQAKLPMFR